ncbi:MAG: hypothetical protein PVJ63_05970 [Thioalkalispiraceae bacterium]|jgi:hypothetical protein
MTEEHSRDDDKRAPSVTRNAAQIDTGSTKGLAVTPSPFNPVKLELGYIIVSGLLLLLIVHRITDNPRVQLLILAVFGVLAMLRLILRVRRVLRQQLTPYE